MNLKSQIIIIDNNIVNMFDGPTTLYKIIRRMNLKSIEGPLHKQNDKLISIFTSYKY